MSDEGCNQILQDFIYLGHIIEPLYTAQKLQDSIAANCIARIPLNNHIPDEDFKLVSTAFLQDLQKKSPHQLKYIATPYVIQLAISGIISWESLN